MAHFQWYTDRILAIYYDIQEYGVVLALFGIRKWIPNRQEKSIAIIDPCAFFVYFFVLEAGCPP